MAQENNKYKILIVEDDAFLIEIYSTKLDLEGFTTLQATSGERGLEIAKKEKPDIMLLDILLPKLDGFDVLKMLQKDEETKNIPVILLTNLSQKEDVHRGLELGAKDYLIKAHFMPSEVIKKIKAVMKKIK